MTWLSSRTIYNGSALCHAWKGDSLYQDFNNVTSPQIFCFYIHIVFHTHLSLLNDLELIVLECH